MAKNGQEASGRCAKFTCTFRAVAQSDFGVTNALSQAAMKRYMLKIYDGGQVAKLSDAF